MLNKYNFTIEHCLGKFSLKCAFRFTDNIYFNLKRFKVNNLYFQDYFLQLLFNVLISHVKITDANKFPTGLASNAKRQHVSRPKPLRKSLLRKKISASAQRERERATKKKNKQTKRKKKKKKKKKHISTTQWAKSDCFFPRLFYDQPCRDVVKRL